MNVVEAVILGIVQGATEFLPVSSSGHLVLVPYFFNIPEPSVFFDVVLHLGTLAALISFFWRDLLKIIKAPLLKSSNETGSSLRLLFLLFLATVPAVVLGFAFKSFFESLFSNVRAVSLFLIATGFILFLAEKLGRKNRVLNNMNWKDSLIIGLAQTLAFIPGISRSGVTISAGLVKNFKREEAARFSFLMAIPVIAGAGIVKFFDSYAELTDRSAALFLSGFTAALISGFLAIHFLLNFIQRLRLSYFAYYCWLAGALSFALTFYIKG